MPDSPFKVLPSITIGQTDIVMTRHGPSKKTVASILGQETDPATGHRTIWLDRLVHRADEARFDSGNSTWAVTGAISTILHEEAPRETA